ncbi:hypothetical protein ACHAXA_006169, partial [Cyclostephanos tholiformis]
NMSKSYYAESSSQTNKEDSHLHLHGEHCKDVSNSGIQRENCDLESLTCVHQDEGVVASSIDNYGDLRRRFNPTRPGDFATLQAELVRWRCREERKITDISRNDGEKQEMTKLLLKREAHLLRKIEQLKNSATEKCKREKIRHVMELMSQPKQWEASDGSVIAVDNPVTCRAREMKAMHDELSGLVKSVEERIRLLGRIKAFVDKVEHSSLAEDVSMLLDRELQMLHQCTDIGQEFMEGMRVRLFNQFTKLVMRLNSDACNGAER